jgi:hypothetical protein
MARLRLLVHSRHWLALAALALLALALGSAMFSGASFTSKSANTASLAAGSVKLSSSRSSSQAIVEATAGMKPGESREGTIKIGNEGSVSGVVRLVASGLGGTALAAALDLEVAQLGKFGSSKVWSGKLSDFQEVGLGSFAVKEAREYKFTLSWPSSESGSSLQGASTSLTFEWTGASEP